ncbi:hypothetical protein NPIL_435341 [Nephila pilipes]|uniref:Uncharacterized protein n=1 Tax=Nephila pilipes TaxID=299642 RepID=A0A8X6Q999_NEPPI|nr:hypothetical protein NPIL_435341 [Nephila pilipes]
MSMVIHPLKQTLEQWNKVFFISIGVVMSSGIIFLFFGSAEVQSWNFPHSDVENGNDEKTKQSLSLEDSLDSKKTNTKL